MTQWKLDGIFTKGEAFVEIAKIFVKAKEAFEKGQWTPTLMEELNQQILAHHPADRELDEGFFVKDPNEVK